ncbi:Rox3-domain-containing protein [Trichodelitschia bisporula]|uniref:Mediator of RNA polymerase II transcription subunit 19 n=1 Tax=Trichodelitschia bisporula TaxID=703511 RepID=A0A6G1HZD6_9PEZI|nr:Rox3-domain-containing protein [Trichodelitschia bisporula]
MDNSFHPAIAQGAAQSQRTDHDRQGDATTLMRPQNPLKNSPLAYLPEKSWEAIRPHPSQNLISMYGLDSIATSVRRIDPVTGEKINKLRKSYEGKIKAMHLAGVNKAVNAPGEFFPNILMFPDEEWDVQKAAAHRISGGLKRPFLRNLDAAMEMDRGPLPAQEMEKWRRIVGSDDVVKKAVSVAPEPVRKALTGRVGSSVPSPGLKAVRPDRPERTGTKRRYDDSSFKGYGEGYADDDLEGDDDGGVGGVRKKQRRKDYPVGTPLGQNQQYNVGLMAGGSRR